MRFRVKDLGRPDLRLGADPVGAVRSSLVASGVAGVRPSYEMTQGGPVDFLFVTTALENGYSEMSHSMWPSESEGLAADTPGRLVFRDGEAGLYILDDGSVALVSVRHGWASVRVAAASRQSVVSGIGLYQAHYPATYLAAREDRVPITFWTHGPHGPERRLRMIDAASWQTVESNYPPSIRGSVERLMTEFRPGDSGQLILWQGPPGTGKTWALRALASEWLGWAEFHYITDPDAFFVDRPSYMIDVLLSETYEVLDGPDGDVVAESDEQGKWRLLILEDTGELLSANAKEKYGQGLSRLLNVVDGMIGQGLRVMCLVTTNDELGELNPAILRPGRCAAQIVFPPFSAEEATEWLGSPVADAATVAELYSLRGDATDPLTAAAASSGLSTEGSAHAAAGGSVVDEIRRVAAEYQEEAVGYGETAWNPDTRTVLWVHGDWTDHDAARDAFLSIDGVDAFDCEGESLPGGWWDAEVVFPDDPPKWVTEPPEVREQRLADVLALARAPFSLDDDWDAVERPARRSPAPVAVPAAPGRDGLAERALDALVAFAGRAEQAPTVHVHMPATSLGVDVRTPNVEVPVTVEQPDIHNHIAAAAAEAPTVHVHVPEQPAPEVHNHVETPSVTVEAPNVEVTVERPRPMAMRVERDPDGTKVFVPEEVEG